MLKIMSQSINQSINSCQLPNQRRFRYRRIAVLHKLTRRNETFIRCFLSSARSSDLYTIRDLGEGIYLKLYDLILPYTKIFSLILQDLEKFRCFRDECKI